MDTAPTPAARPVVVPPSGGTALAAFGERVLVKLGGVETRNQFTAWVETTPPGGGPPPHHHDAEDELFLVLAGRVEFLVDGAWVEPGEGAVVYIPRGNVHAFRNAGPSDVRMFILTTPSGFETFFGRCADEFAKPGGPDMPAVLAISAGHGIHFVPPPAATTSPA